MVENGTDCHSAVHVRDPGNLRRVVELSDFVISTGQSVRQMTFVSGLGGQLFVFWICHFAQTFNN